MEKTIAVSESCWAGRRGRRNGRCGRSFSQGPTIGATRHERMPMDDRERHFVGREEPDFSMRSQPKITLGAHAILLLDQAGWHGANALKVPNNISFARAPRFE